MTRNTPNSCTDKQKTRQKALSASSQKAGKQSENRTPEQGQKKADAILEKCFGDLPDRPASNAFLDAIRDCLHYAVVEGNETQIDVFAAGVDDLFTRWHRIKDGNGKKLAKVYLKVVDLLPRRGDQSHTPESIQLCKDAANALLALNLSLLQSIWIKAQVYFDNHQPEEPKPDPEHERRSRVTQVLFDQFPNDESRIEKIVELIEQVPYLHVDYENGESPLHAAIRAGCPRDVITVLLLAGTNINAYTRFGETALHIALAKGDFNAALTLLENGADPTLETSDYITTQMQMEQVLTKVELLKTRLGMSPNPAASTGQADHKSTKATGAKP